MVSEIGAVDRALEMLDMVKVKILFEVRTEGLEGKLESVIAFKNFGTQKSC